MNVPLTRLVPLPKKARAFLCPTCLEALRQRHAMEVEQAPFVESECRANLTGLLRRM